MQEILPWLLLAGIAFDGSGVLTVPTAGFAGTEFAVIRCDYVLTPKALAAHAVSYKVIRTSASGMADHCPVLGTFEVLQ